MYNTLIGCLLRFYSTKVLPVIHAVRPVGSVGHGGGGGGGVAKVCPPLQKIQPNSSDMDMIYVYKNKLCPLLKLSVPPLETSVPPLVKKKNLTKSKTLTPMLTQ